VDNIAFALTAVTIDTKKVRQRASAAKGRLVRIDDDDTHRKWSAELYAEIRARNVLASVRSAEHIWLLLAKAVRSPKLGTWLAAAKDACGEPLEVLAQLFFLEDMAKIAPFGCVTYLGNLHVAVDFSWKHGAPQVCMLDVRLAPVHSEHWLLQMRSVSYSNDLEHVERTARCFTVRPKGKSLLLMPTPKGEAKGHRAYATTSAISHKVPWKARPSAAADRIDKYGLLKVILERMSQTLGLAMLDVSVEPLYQHRGVGSATQAKKELTHEHVIGQVATTLEGYEFHVSSHLGRPDFLASLMAQMFPFAKWHPITHAMDGPEGVENLLAIVNTPRKDEDDSDDVKLALRSVGFPVLQCITDTTVGVIGKSIQRRRAKVDADALSGRLERRRPLQEHEVIARALLIQLLVKIELRQKTFLLPRPWMGKVAGERYAFVCHEYGNPAWVVILPKDDSHFDIQIVENRRRIRFGSRIPVLIDPPQKGKDSRGLEFERICASARHCIIIRNTEINAYSAHRGGHAGIWLIPELFAYISLGSDAASSDLSTKVAPRLRIVEAFDYGMPADHEQRWQDTLDMASLAYDPTVRLFKTSAFPVFAKLSAEALDALAPTPPANP